MIMRNNQRGFSLVVGLLFIVAVCVIGLAARQVLLKDDNLPSSSLDTQLSPKGIKVEIANSAKNYSKDHFVDIKLTIRNDSSSPQDFPSSCAEKLVYFVDGKQKNEERAATCKIGYPPFNPKSVKNRIETYDPIKLKQGEHILQVRVNGFLSNKLKIVISNPPSSIKNCYEYIKDVTPLCKNIVITDNGDTINVNTGIADVTTDRNGTVVESTSPTDTAKYGAAANQRCLKIRQIYFANAQLQPIQKLSTMQCNNGKLAYFVANVQPSDFKMWYEKITQSDPALDLATGNPALTYPEL